MQFIGARPVPTLRMVRHMAATPTDSSSPLSGSTRMRARARLINLIGDELISDEPVAVVELVKNAYDADAKRVDVSFEGDDPRAPQRIVIADNGVGMDLDIVLNAWLEPGTARKKQNARSPGGRLYLGAKGIGRFATARLGSSLLLETRAAGQDLVVYVLLNWGAFTDDGYLEDVEVEYEARVDAQMPVGTRLTIEGLRQDAWRRESFETLHARLSRLISPFKENEDFEIALNIPGLPELSGVVQAPELLLKPKYLLDGRLDSNGHFLGNISIDGADTPIDRMLGRGDEKPECGDFRVEIRAWDRDRAGLAPIAARENLAISQVRKTLDTYCGVSIYRDGFRVHPYGETGNDWLSLDLRSRQNPARNLANNQTIAAIRISRDSNPNLQDRSTREGMIRNVAHSALEDWFRRVIAILEEARYKSRPRKGPAPRGDQLFEPFDLKGAVERTENTLGASHPITKLLAETERQVSEGVDRIQEVFSRLLMSAGLGHMVDIVIHEIGAPLGKTNRQLAILERSLKKMLSHEEYQNVASSIASIRTWQEQIHGLRQRLDPQTPSKRGRASTFDVADEVQLTFELYAALIQKQGIAVHFSRPVDPIQVRMSNAALSQVLANLIDNALFWIIQKKGVAHGGQIQADLRSIPNGFAVAISDDGPGVSSENHETIFEPYFSTKPNGIGLGLYIARLVIEPYGRLVLRDEGVLGGATFEARFEKGVGL